MTAPTIRLATAEDMRAITSQNLDAIFELPFIYIPTDEPDVMRSWGVAGTPGGSANTVVQAERLHPGSLVSPKFAGQTASRGDLLYNGAEPASAFVP